MWKIYYGRSPYIFFFSKKKTRSSLICYCPEKNKHLLITFSPAKNGALMFFVGDHTFFGEVVNFAETLQTICRYKEADLSLIYEFLHLNCLHSITKFPLKTKKMWLVFRLWYTNFFLFYFFFYFKLTPGQQSDSCTLPFSLSRRTLGTRDVRLWGQRIFESIDFSWLTLWKQRNLERKSKFLCRPLQNSNVKWPNASLSSEREPAAICVPDLVSWFLQR